METLYMGEEQIVVKIGEKEKTYPAGVSFLSIAQEYQDQYEDDIVLALYNNRLRELKKTVKKDGELSFLTTSDKTGKRAYRRSVDAKSSLQSVGQRAYWRLCQICHRSGILL